MKKFKSIRLTILLILALLFSNAVSAATGSFVATGNGIRYVYKTDNGVTKYVTPKYDSKTGTYYVVDSQNRVIAQQHLGSEASMNQIKIITASGQGNTQDFLGNNVEILTPMSSSDPRYQQLRKYIESNPSLQKVFGMQYQARSYKINKIKQDVIEGVRDESLADWLTTDLKKPIYLEVGSDGTICHDGAGFVLVERDSNGQTTYRDNSYVNRIVISDTSEIFSGNTSDPTSASIIAHETGHMIMDQLYETPNYPKSDYYGSHSKNTVSDEGFAISEGWAEALEALSTKEYRKTNGTGDSWRLKTQQNIEDNKYIYKDAGVTNVTNYGALKTSGEMLSTEGVNASMFYDMLESKGIQNSYTKICSVFEEAKPQTYREFVYDYINKYPEDQSQVTRIFLEDTKYTTVDSTAMARYSDLYQAEQAYLNAPDSISKAQLKAVYESKKQVYDSYNESLYRQACVDGTIDSAVVVTGNTNSSYRSMRVAETWLKTRRALDTGVEKAGSSLKNSFSVKNMAVTAGTSIAINIASQLMNGEKVSLKSAVQAVASMQFVGNFVGSSLGAAAGQVVVPLVQTFVPGIVGSLAGALIPAVTSLVGGNIGSSLGSGVSFKEALKSVDMVAVSGQAVGSMLGSMLGSMIPIPVVGSMLGGIVGGIVGEKVFTAVRNFVKKLFGKKDDTVVIKGAGESAKVVLVKSSGKTSKTSSMANAGLRIPEEAEASSIAKITSDIRTLKEKYETAYNAYVTAVISGDSSSIEKALQDYNSAKSAYEQALAKAN